jgi:bacteriocin-like protein
MSDKPSDKSKPQEDRIDNKPLASDQSESENTKPDGELSDEELNNVAGGKVTLSDFHFTKQIDKSSP